MRIPRFLCALGMVAAGCAFARPEARVVEVGAMPAGVKIDGGLEDWPADATTILLGEAAHTLPRAAKWGGARDLSGTVRVAWNVEALWLAADVVDDKPLQAAATGAEPWHGDSIEVFFNAFPGEQRKTGFWQIALVPPLAPDAKLAVLCPQGELPGVEGAAVVRANGYTLECRIPWANFGGFSAREAARLGFQVMLNDRDGKGRKSQLCWYPSAVTYIHPLDMNVLALGANGAGVVGDVMLAGPNTAVVTDAKTAFLSAVAEAPAAVEARFSMEGGEWLKVPVARSGERLAVAEAKCPTGGREGAAEFRMELTDAAGAVVAKRSFTVELAGGRYAAMRARLKAARDRLKALPDTNAEARAGAGFWIWRVGALEANEARSEAVTAEMLNELLVELDGIEDALGKLERGEEPYAGRTGSFVRAYRSPLTGEFRPHSLFVPADIKAGEKRPLIVVLHGIFGDDRHLFQMLDAVRGLGAIVYQAASYRQFDWADISAAETWAGLDQVLATQPVDADRVYLIGHHIGGRGVLQLAMARPWLFAALAPMYPGIDTRPPYEALRLYPRFYEEAAKRNLIPFPHYKEPAPPEVILDHGKRLRMERLSLATRADNIAALPIRMVRGEEQPDAAAERLALIERLRALGANVSERHEIGAQHGSRPPELEDAEFYRWLLEQRRGARPEVCEQVIAGLRNNETWFARIDAFTSPTEVARVRAVWAGGTPKLKTANAEALSPVFERGRFERWEVDGQEFVAVPLVRNAKGFWEQGRAEDGLKRHGLSGPIDDFQFDRFLYVYGKTDEKVARKLANRGLGTEFLAKADGDVTVEDRANAHLVLVGTPETNAELARLAGKLPIIWEAGGIKIGDVTVSGPGSGACVIYPNPDHAGRYVVVITATDEQGYGVWKERAGADYVLVGASQAEKGKLAVAGRGVFGNRWEFDPNLRINPMEESLR